jgi:WD40 repeat protein
MSGGLDNNVVSYQKVDGKFKEVTRSNFGSYFYSIKINPYVNTRNKFFVGCKDSKIYVLDHQANPTKVLEGHTSPVSSISFINSDEFISGSWDVSEIVWISQVTNLLLLLHINVLFL